jgi:hypothetical protein
MQQRGAFARDVRRWHRAHALQPVVASEAGAAGTGPGRCGIMPKHGDARSRFTRSTAADYPRTGLRRSCLKFVICGAAENVFHPLRINRLTFLNQVAR